MKIIKYMLLTFAFIISLNSNYFVVSAQSSKERTKSYGGGGSKPRPPKDYKPYSNLGPRIYGTVKWFNPEKGFGFITSDDERKDAFVTAEELRKTYSNFLTMNDGERVTFVLIKGRKGLVAEDVIREDLK